MAFPCFQLLYVTLAIDKMDGHGLSNTARRERLPKKTKVTWYRIAGYFERLNFQKHPSKYDFEKIFSKIVQTMCAS